MEICSVLAHVLSDFSSPRCISLLGDGGTRPPPSRPSDTSGPFCNLLQWSYLRSSTRGHSLIAANQLPRSVRDTPKAKQSWNSARSDTNGHEVHVAFLWLHRRWFSSIELTFKLRFELPTVSSSLWDIEASKPFVINNYNEVWVYLFEKCKVTRL